MKILFFSKPDCQPCASVVAWFADNNTSYEKIDAYDSPELAAKYMVRILPTTILVEDSGEVVDHFTGYKPDQLASISLQVQSQ